MKKIPLTQGKFALVDDEDFELVSQYKWYAHFNKSKKFWYAARKEWSESEKKYKNIKMHRLILGLQAKDKEKVDHINNDGLDNRRINLRICTQQQNSQNRYNAWGLSKYKGVSWYKQCKRWGASIGLNGKKQHLGCFENELDAAAAYGLAALKHFGEFANTNFEMSLAT